MKLPKKLERVGGSEATAHTMRAKRSPEQVAQKGRRCKARRSERGGVAELRREQIRKRGDAANGPFSATCQCGRGCGLPWPQPLRHGAGANDPAAIGQLPELISSAIVNLSSFVPSLSPCDSTSRARPGSDGSGGAALVACSSCMSTIVIAGPKWCPRRTSASRRRSPFALREVVDPDLPELRRSGRRCR